MRKVAVLLLIACALAWWAWPRAADPSPPAPTAMPPAAAAPAPQPVQAAAPPAATQPPAAEAAAERTAAPAPAPPAGGPECTLRGRVVDERGNPIAGVHASLTGWGANDERVNAWRKDHDEPKRIDAKADTGADGVFEFHCWPPPPFQFALRLTGDGRAPTSGRWSELPGGRTKDLGDIAMPPGTRLRGRVVDGDGAPLAGVDVHFDNRDRTGHGGIGDGMRAEAWDSPRTAADGTFTGRW